MSAAQIMEELPKLSTTELIAIRRKLIEVAERNEDVALCDAMAAEAAAMLDQLEDDHAGSR